MPAIKSKKTGASKARKQTPPARRAYNSPLRQQQAVDTRQRILSVGVQIARELPSWDWSAMTFKAVGDGAAMSERTVRRHFTSERALRDAIQQRLMQECGVDFERVEVPQFAEAAEQVHRYLAGFASAPPPQADPGFTAMDAGRRAALLKAVARVTPNWKPADRAIAAATLDLYWNPLNFERFGSAWQLDQDQVAKLIRWAVRLMQDAIRDGKRP
jgi:AcrR family transcriptional regulator